MRINNARRGAPLTITHRNALLTPDGRKRLVSAAVRSSQSARYWSNPCSSAPTPTSRLTPADRMLLRPRRKLEELLDLFAQVKVVMRRPDDQPGGRS